MPGVYVCWNERREIYVGQGEEPRAKESLKERSCVGYRILLRTEDYQEAYLIEDRLWCMYQEANVVTLNIWRPKYTWWMPWDEFTPEEVVECFRVRSEAVRRSCQTSEYREMMSQILFDRWADDEYRARVSASMKVAHSLPETRLRHGEASKTLWTDEETTARRLAAQRVSMSSEDYRQKMRHLTTSLWGEESYREKVLAAVEASRDRWRESFLATTSDPDWKAQQSETMKVALNNDVIRQKMSEATTKQWEEKRDEMSAAQRDGWDAEARAQASESKKRNWSNPAYKAAQLAKQAAGRAAKVHVSEVCPHCNKSFQRLARHIHTCPQKPADTFKC